MIERCNIDKDTTNDFHGFIPNGLLLLSSLQAFDRNFWTTMCEDGTFPWPRLQTLTIQLVAEGRRDTKDGATSFWTDARQCTHWEPFSTPIDMFICFQSSQCSWFPGNNSHLVAFGVFFTNHALPWEREPVATKQSLIQ
jgi:hypothetical protein